MAAVRLPVGGDAMQNRGNFIFMLILVGAFILVLAASGAGQILLQYLNAFLLSLGIR